MWVANPDCRNQYDSTQSFDVTVLQVSPVEGEFNQHLDFEAKAGTAYATATTQHRKKRELFYLQGTSTTSFNV